MRALNSYILLGALSVMTLTEPTVATAAASDVNVTIVNPAKRYDPTAHGYSHAVISQGEVRTAYIAGQGGDDRSGALSPEFAGQVKQAYANLRIVLETIGATPAQVTKITTYVVDYDQSKLEVMAHYVRETFGDALPAQTLVPVPRLALDGMLFEVDAIAVLPGEGK